MASDFEERIEGLPVLGYQKQSLDSVARVNLNKEAEEINLRQMDDDITDGVVDRRWMAIARTHFDQAWMAYNRAIFQPARVKLSGDK